MRILFVNSDQTARISMVKCLHCLNIACCLLHASLYAVERAKNRKSFVHWTFPNFSILLVRTDMNLLNLNGHHLIYLARDGLLFNNKNNNYSCQTKKAVWCTCE